MRKRWLDLGLWLWMRPAWFGVASGLAMAGGLALGLPFLGMPTENVVVRAGVLGVFWGVCVGMYRHREMGRNARRRESRWDTEGSGHRSDMG